MRSRSVAEGLPEEPQEPQPQHTVRAKSPLATPRHWTDDLAAGARPVDARLLLDFDHRLRTDARRQQLGHGRLLELLLGQQRQQVIVFIFQLAPLLVELLQRLLRYFRVEVS